MGSKTISILAVYLISLSFSCRVVGQIYKTNEGIISFYSEAPLENIEAINKHVGCAFNLENGKIAFSLYIRDFEFEKKLMREHFNDNYLESSIYPKATFVGEIENFNQEIFKSGQETKYLFIGKLFIHGIEQEIKTEALLSHMKGEIVGDAHFDIRPADYGIKIPKAVILNIAEVVSVHVKVKLKIQSE